MQCWLLIKALKQLLEHSKKEMKRILAILLLALPVLLHAKLQPTKASHVEADFVQSWVSYPTTNTWTQPSIVKELTGHLAFDAPGTLLWQYDNDTVAVLPPDLFRILTRIFAGKPAGSNFEFTVEEKGNALLFIPKRKPLNLRYRQIEVAYNPLTGIAKEMFVTLVPEQASADATPADSGAKESAAVTKLTFSFSYVTFR